MPPGSTRLWIAGSVIALGAALLVTFSVVTRIANRAPVPEAIPTPEDATAVADDAQPGKPSIEEVRAALEDFNAGPVGYRDAIHGSFSANGWEGTCWAGFSPDDREQLVITFTWPTGGWIRLLPQDVFDPAMIETGDDFIAAGIDPAALEASGRRCGNDQFDKVWLWGDGPPDG